MSAAGPTPVAAPARRPGRSDVTHLAGLDPEQLRAHVVALGEPAYRARQLSRHYYDGAGDDASAMTDLPAARRAGLAAALLPPLLTERRVLTTDGGRTRKTLWSCADGAMVESVLMGYPGRATVCVSSQAGCGMGCPFCATGQGGLTRNLTTAEIVDQVVRAARDVRAGLLPGGPPRLGNVVFMGMGEPLANYRPLVRALRRLTDPAPEGLGLSPRSLTVSTVGLVPAIDRLAGEGLQVRLAVSLHAPDDELRDELVPVNRRWPVAQVLAAAWRYGRATGRRVSVEYALIRDVNDQVQRARALAALLAGHRAHVNLIPLNPTPGSPWTASRPADRERFLAVLRAAGVPATVRDTRGREVDAACGQLAATG